jgi:Single-stranded DNA binding protein Ssb-like, OB fold
LNQKKPTILEELAFISVKHRVYLGELFKALVSARENGKSRCMNLTIQYRGSICSNAIFLITENSKVIVQFRVPEELLSRKDICFESWMNNDKIRKQMYKQDCVPHVCTMVQDLRYGMKRVSVEAEVLEPPESSSIRTRYGSSAVVTNIWIGDETGKVKLCLWNEPAVSLIQGDMIQIKNASVSMFKGERQLLLGRSGTINLLPRQTSKSQPQGALIAKTMVQARGST